MLFRAARIAAPRLVAARPALRRAVPPAVVAGSSFSIYQSLTTFHALALNMEAPPPSPLQVSGEAVLNADPALGGANVPVAPEQEESDDGLDEEQYDDAWQVLELQDRVRSDLFTHDGIVIGFGKAGSLVAGKVQIEVESAREKKLVQRWVDVACRMSVPRISSPLARARSMHHGLGHQLCAPTHDRTGGPDSLSRVCDPTRDRRAGQAPRRSFSFLRRAAGRGGQTSVSSLSV